MKPLLHVAVPIALGLVLSSCTGPREEPEPQAPVRESPPLADGLYDVQSIAYDDATGAYDLFLLNPPAGAPPKYTTTKVRFQRLSDEDVAAGKKATLTVDAAANATEAVEGPVASLPPEFQINYTHNVVEDRGGQQVVVRQESSMWSPFLTGMLIGQMMRPMYFYPPPYRPGVPMNGVGGFGATRSLAEQNFSQQHGTQPQSSKLAKSGYAKMPSASGVKASGTGAGSSRLSGNKDTSKQQRPTGRRSFGGRRR